MARSSADQQLTGLYGRAPENHLFSGARNTVLYPGTIILLGNEARGGRTSVQTAFKNANDITIYGGFFATDAGSAALEHIKPILSPYGELELAIRREEAALKREMLSLELERQQAQRDFRARNEKTYAREVFGAKSAGRGITPTQPKTISLHPKGTAFTS